MRTLQRSFQRAGYPLKYSEGFNPHPLLSVALPMSVGISSVCELLDFKMDECPDDFILMKNRISDSLPEGLDILDIYHPLSKVSEIKWLEIQGTLQYDIGIQKSALMKLQHFFEQDHIEVMKKSKHGEKLFDCSPHIKCIDIRTTDCNSIIMHGYISAQNPTINPNLLIKALPDSLKPDYAKFSRLEIYRENMTAFR